MFLNLRSRLSNSKKLWRKYDWRLPVSHMSGAVRIQNPDRWHLPSVIPEHRIRRNALCLLWVGYMFHWRKHFLMWQWATQILSALVLLSQVNESFVISQVTTISFIASSVQWIFIKNYVCTWSLRGNKNQWSVSEPLHLKHIQAGERNRSSYKYTSEQWLF